MFTDQYEQVGCLLTDRTPIVMYGFTKSNSYEKIIYYVPFDMRGDLALLESSTKFHI